MALTNSNPTRSNQSTEKALSILELLAGQPAPMRLMDIAKSLQLNTSTAARFLSSLVTCGYVAQEPESQRYYMTYKICRIANRVSASTSLQSITHPYLVSLSESIGEAICVSVEQDMVMVYVDVAYAHSQTLLSIQRVGNTTPMHCTGNGKLLLSAYTPEQLNRYIEVRGLDRYTENTITEREPLVSELEAIRRRGYAVDNQEREAGVRCLACPIRDYTGAIIAGISVTGPAMRMTDEAIDLYRAPLSEAARRISFDLGYAESSNFNN